MCITQYAVESIFECYEYEPFMIQTLMCIN